jgi:DHA1 family tetracycline resistance protein-like MFS transporter
MYPVCGEGSLVTARAPAVAFILVTVALDVVAFGIVAPVLPQLIREFQNGDASRAAETYGVFATAWALMQFVFSPLLGMLSDRFGRRKVLLLSLLGLGLDYVLMALAPSLAWLFVGRVISGITAATYATSAAYIADVTPPEQRAAKFGLVGAAWGIGFIAGPLLGGVLGDIDLRLPFWAAAVLALVNAAYGWFVLPESLPKEKRAVAFEWKRANPIGALSLVRSRKGLTGLVAVQGLYTVAHYSLPSVFVLYASYRYQWGPKEVGLTLAFIGICTAVVQGGLVGRIVRALGSRRAAIVGLACGATAYTGYALAPSGLWMVPPIIVGAFNGLYGPAVQALMTERVGPSEQGQLQGINGSLLGLAGLFAPVLFTFSFAQSIRPDSGVHVPGMPFFIAAALTIAALLLAIKVARHATPPPDSTPAVAMREAA